MVNELGLPNHMADSTAQWQQMLGDLPLETDDIGEVLKAFGKA